MDELFSCVNIFLVTGLLIALAKKQNKTKTKNKQTKKNNWQKGHRTLKIWKCYDYVKIS